jgi:hypothetical protein
MTEGAAGRPDPRAAIEALRARGAHRIDPVRFRRIEALARRAAAHRGEARRLLDGRLEALLSAYARDTEPARTAAAGTPAPPRQRSALADLLADLTSDAQAPGTPAGHGPPIAQAGAELRTVRQHRSTWARLSVERRMAQSQALVPENAGPLNTQRLLHQALTLMRDASPDYVHRFISHVEALLWLDQASPAGTAATKEATRGARAGRRSR